MFYDDATAVELKKAFGAALLRHPDNPFAAAREIEPSQSTGRANWIVATWLDDPLVIATAGKRVADMGALAGLPSKEELALKAYREDVSDKDTKLKYLQFVAELLGYVQKGGGININNNNQVNNLPKIMVVPAFADEKTWEATAIAQQRKLQQT